jgi:lysophospholipid acyltransferase (LPLAT)-like uncharacterized protein
MRARDYPWWMVIAAPIAAWLLVALGATWRIVRVRVHEREALLGRGERCIFALWHSRLLPLAFTHRGRSVALLISRHRDGELIARIITRLGYRTARGSSTRGGEEGIREMLRHAEEGHLLGITPDGPRGPAEQVKPGLVYLASRTGYPILPVAAAAKGEWVLDSWDRFRIPFPFTTVVVAYGPPILVPARLSDEEIEVWRVRIEAGLRELTAEVERAAAGGAGA